MVRVLYLFNSLKVKNLDDAVVGKTDLLMTYLYKKYPDSDPQLPTVVENYCTTVDFRGEKWTRTI